MQWGNFVKERQYNDNEEEELLRALNHQMYVVAYAKMKNKSDALDVVQDSWVKILRKIDTLKDQDKLFQWAKTIVSNTALNSIKQKTIKHGVLVCHELLEEAFPMNETQMDNRVILNELYENMATLDQQSRKILVYKFHFGYKDQCIADKLQLPLGTVKARIHRKIKRMRDHYIT